MFKFSGFSQSWLMSAPKRKQKKVVSWFLGLSVVLSVIVVTFFVKEQHGLTAFLLGNVVVALAYFIANLRLLLTPITPIAEEMLMFVFRAVIAKWVVVAVLSFMIFGGLPAYVESPYIGLYFAGLFVQMVCGAALSAWVSR